MRDAGWHVFNLPGRHREDGGQTLNRRPDPKPDARAARHGVSQALPERLPGRHRRTPSRHPALAQSWHDVPPPERHFRTMPEEAYASDAMTHDAYKAFASFGKRLRGERMVLRLRLRRERRLCYQDPMRFTLGQTRTRDGAAQARRPGWVRAFVRACGIACLCGLMQTGVRAQPDAPQRIESLQRPVATDARIVAEGGVTRLSFRLSRPVEASGFAMEEPDRIVIDMPELNFQSPVQVGRKTQGLVSGFRFGLFAPGRSRIVIDLTGPARLTRLESAEVPGGIATLDIELQATDRAAFAEAAAQARRKRPSTAPDPQPANGAQASLPNAQGVDRRPVVVIDPGHGGIDPGAVTPQVAEKTIVLAFAQKLRDLIGQDYRVVMTRDDDRFLSLSERVKVARQNNADLFISIHADSLSKAQDVRGATIYTASERATDAESARLAARENEVDSLAGLDAPLEDREDIADILLDLAKRETRAFSAQIAARLVAEMGGAVKLHRIPHRSAGFRVLAAPDVPSVLIELGYVSSAKDVELLTSEAWRTEAAKSMRRAIDRFFADRRAPYATSAP
jgi:N-acetylmuramoyl-L-alanine amidase